MHNKNSAMAFIILLGVVSLFSDMTHEAATSIKGAYLLILGASASTIVFFFGLAWFLGSWLLGAVYDYSLNTFIIVSVAAQLIALPCYLLSERSLTRETANELLQRLHSLMYSCIHKKMLKKGLRSSKSVL